MIPVHCTCPKCSKSATMTEDDIKFNNTRLAEQKEFEHPMSSSK